MSEKTILIVDDDAKVRTLLRKALEAEGFQVREAETASAALAEIGTSKIHLVTLDIQLGTDSGLDVARKIRETSKVPIIMVTARSDVIDRVVGLEVGADDYISKPFHVREVVARVRSVLRRTEELHEEGSRPEDTNCLSFDGITVWPEHMKVLDRLGNESDLTSGDFKLLMVFLEHPKRVLSRDQLMDFVGGTEWSPLDRTIDNQVARLRKKIERTPTEPKLIKTVRGIGYTFACDVIQSSEVSANSS